LEKAEEGLLNQIPPALQINEIKGWLTNESRRSLVARHRLGRIVREVYEDDQKDHAEQRYGRKSMKKLCRALPLSASLLYDALRLAQAFSEDKVGRLAHTQTSSGRFLYWAHLQQLAPLGQPTRDDMLARVVAEDLTADRLAGEVRRLRGGKPNDRGRKPVPPRNLGGVLDQQAACADRFLERSKLWSDEHSLLEQVQGLRREGHTEEMARRLTAHRDKLWRLAREATAKAEEADRAYETFCKGLARAKEIAEARGRQTEQEQAGHAEEAAAEEEAWVAVAV
jgi:hypothetical protein